MDLGEVTLSLVLADALVGLFLMCRYVWRTRKE